MGEVFPEEGHTLFILSRADRASRQRMPSPITMIAMRHGVTNSTRAVLKRMRSGSAQVLPVDTADEAGECMVLRVDGVEHRVTTASAGAPSAVFAVK